jgi:hypothetical protein
LEVFIHSQERDLEVVEVGPDSTIREIMEERSVVEEIQVWLEDQDEPIDIELTIEQLKIESGAHLHHSRCKEVAVEVVFNGQDNHRAFAPSTRVEKVFKWASDAFKIPQDQRANHMLRVAGTNEEPNPDAHIGELAHDCSINFILAPRHRHQG